MARPRSPTLVTVAAFVVVFAAQLVAGVAGALTSLFVLSAPLADQPWTLVTSVYAHGGPGHLLANTVALLVPGLVLERRTTALRFHAFFVTSGAIAGAAEVTLGGLVGEPTGVLGASGAVFALFGYLLTSNRLADTAFRGFAISGLAQVVGFAVFATLVTVATAAPRVALVAHFTGLLVGLLAGRVHLLRP